MLKAKRLDPDLRTGDYRYELSDGRYLSLKLYDVQRYGERDLLRLHGVELSHERLPVMQHGARLGTLPRNFDWRTERPTSPLVDIRHDDFTLVESPDGDYWQATRMLMSGDLDAIPSFRRL